MIEKTYKCFIDLSEKENHHIPEMTFCKGDYGTSAIEFVFSEKPDSPAVRIFINKPDGTKIYNDIPYSSENGRCLYELTTQAKAVEGVYAACLQIQCGEDLREIGGITYTVTESQIDEDAVESQNDFTALITAAQIAVQKAADAETFAQSASESAQAAANSILGTIAVHDADIYSHSYILSKITNAEAIARGRARGLKFDTTEQLDSWLSGTYTRPDGLTAGDLEIGDNLYIVDLSVPDYWWDGENKQLLEANAINLADFYTKPEVDARIPITVSRSEYNYLYNQGLLLAGRSYDIYEEDD